MVSFAKEFKEKVNHSKEDPRYRQAQERFWEYEKLINPKFFKEDRWHLKEIADTLQALLEDRIIREGPDRDWRIISNESKEALAEAGAFFDVCKKLKLNIPPRHGKSYTLALFEQWLFGCDNDTTVITVSYNETLASRFSSNVRDGIDATKIDQKLTVFSDIFPTTKIKYGDSAKNVWSLEGRFFSYLGTAFGGTITGIGCKLGIIDDPVKNAMEAFNDRVLEEQYSWYTDTYLSRVEEGGYQIINMTRWATGDLCGKLEDAEEASEWYTLLYPACLNEEKITKQEECRKANKFDSCLACEKYPCSMIDQEERDQQGNIPGQMLCPELMSFKSWSNKRRLTSAPVFMANYQQKPVDITGSLYAMGFKTYEKGTIDPSDFERICSYGDTADEGEDDLCHICFGVIDRYAYITDIYFTDEPMEVTESETARRIKLNGVREAVIESNNGGKGFARNVEAWLKKWKWKRTNFFWFHQSKNKRARIRSHATNVCEQVIMPEGWEKMWPRFHKAISTYQGKGKDKHDDGPDGLTGVVEVVNGEVKPKRKIKVGSKRKLGIR